MMILKKSSLTIFALWAVCFAAVNAIETDPPVNLADLLTAPSINTAPSTKAPTGSPTAPPTESPAPSPSPSEAPTETPTESPAPSPSPSEAPTTTPTGTPPPTGTPTAEPTESPAPSPSPSETPTNYPTREPSAPPTGFPTISPMPTNSPSESPSERPSESPSETPSSTPTLSTAPSAAPTIAPSAAPSSAPTAAPTAAPTLSAAPSSAPSTFPSDGPSSFPSTVPSELPSTAPTTGAPSESPSKEPTKLPTTEAPTAAPTGAPTDIFYKTKTIVTNVLLVGLENQMEGDILGKFEVATLEFIDDTKPPTPGFDIDLVAVTVLTQTHVDLQNNTVVIDAHGARRKLNDGDIEHAIQVAFRTVGIIGSGKMNGMTFEDIAEDGFKNHFNQYLFRLSKIDDFFSVLDFEESEAAVSEQIEDEKGSKGQFVATILLSTSALIIALFASNYAIKKHLQSQKRITDQGRMLEYPGFTQESTGISGSSDEEERSSSGKTPMLQLEIGDEKIEMEDIGLTPIGEAGPIESPFSHPDERRPLSPSQMEEGEGRPSLTGMSEASSGLKKWLTPRQGLFNNWMQGTPKNDPPESESSFRPSYDPSSRKVSTTTDLGIVQQADRRDTIGGSSRHRQSHGGGHSPLTIPMSFFSGGGDNRSDASGTPMASLAGSSASSFFMKMGKSVFTGRKSMQSDAGRSDVGGRQPPKQFEPERKPSTPQYRYNVQTTDGAESEVEVTRVGSELNAANLAMLTQASSSQMREKISRFEPSQASHASQSSHPMRPHNNTVPKPPQSNSGSQASRNVPPQQPTYVPRSAPPQQRGPANAPPQQRGPSTMPRKMPPHMTQQPEHDLSNGPFRSGKRSVPNDQLRFDNDSPEEDRSKRSRILELESDTESEFSLNEFEEGFEVTGGTLGARAPPPVPSEYTNSSYGQRSMPQRPGMYGNRTANTAYGQHPYNDKPNPMSRPIEQKPNFTLGAQRQHKERTSLSGTYDVFAPSGPIGIVVDTSKHGPAVHSLKATSPMLGLISPGDLIIALDEEDTRNMTAASLTRLMAKKSRQNERKITLLSPDDL